jgi:hypothetical protein
MAIEIMIGLPALRDGPILRRAKTMQVPVLVSANSFSRWSRRKGWPEWRGWNKGLLVNAEGLKSLALDSAGFVAMAKYGAFPWSVDDYLDRAASYPWRWFASMDYCVEPEVARDREEVLDRIARTVRINYDCLGGARERGIAHRLMPVIQGRAATDYERCIDNMAPIIETVALVGVGSMCRRAVRGPEGLVAVFEHLDRVLPPGIKLHGFGIKGNALARLRGLEHRIETVDSQAFGIEARWAALDRGISKTDAFVADHMERWTRRQYARVSGTRFAVQGELALAPADRVPADPWERAIAQARSEIRDLIEEGALSHDEVTIGWIEQWAADLYRDGLAA